MTTSQQVCNSQNNCHCDAQWAPPLCNSPGFGGSIDSGPARATDQPGMISAQDYRSSNIYCSFSFLLFITLPQAGHNQVCYDVVYGAEETSYHSD